MQKKIRFMEVLEKKQELIRWISSLEDDVKIANLWDTMQDIQEEDFAYSLSEEEREGILQGLRDIEEGRTLPHSEVMRKFDKWR